MTCETCRRRVEELERYLEALREDYERLIEVVAKLTGEAYT